MELGKPIADCRMPIRKILAPPAKVRAGIGAERRFPADSAELAAAHAWHEPCSFDGRMSRPRRMLLTVARALATTLIVSLAGSGVSVSAAHVTACDMSASHCQRATIVASCCCHDSGLPAASATSAAVGVAKMPVAAAAPAPASSVCAFPVAARPDYSLARGRQFIPLRLLYSSLLI